MCVVFYQPHDTAATAFAAAYWPLKEAGYFFKIKSSILTRISSSILKVFSYICPVTIFARSGGGIVKKI